MLSFLATFAQEESVKKSEAMNWSLQQRFKDGKLLTPAPLGYDRQKDVTGRYIKYAPLVINESEALFDAQDLPPIESAALGESLLYPAKL